MQLALMRYVSKMQLKLVTFVQFAIMTVYLDSLWPTVIQMISNLVSILIINN
jgi:hypothetical protein